MEKFLLKSAIVQNDKLILSAVSDGLWWKVDIKTVDIRVMLNPYCEEGTWIEVVESTTFGLVPHYVKRVVIYTDTSKARETWRQVILSARNLKKISSEVLPQSYNGPDHPYEPRPLVYEPQTR